MLEYRRADHRPWVAARVQKHFKVAGKAAQPFIEPIEEYFEVLIYDEDVPLAICQKCLEKALKDRQAQSLHAKLEQAKNEALRLA